MTRRLAAAVVAIGTLVVAVGAWRLVSEPAEIPTSVATSSSTADAAPAAPIAADATPTPAPTKRVEPPRPRRRVESSVETATPEPAKLRFHGHAVFEDGRPAVGARVRVFDVSEPSSGSSQLGDEGTVGGDGRFEAGAVDEDCRAVVYGVLPGFAYAGAFKSATDDIVLTFARGGVVTGTVYAADGKPWPDVEVRLVRCDAEGRIATSASGSVWSRPEIAAFYGSSTRSDAAGRFRLEGASLADGGRQTVAVVEGEDGRAWRSEVATFTKSDDELVRDVRVGVNQLDQIDPYGRLEGLVTDADERTIEDAEVLYGVLDGGANDERKSAKTDDAGRFSIRLGRGFKRDGRAVVVRVGAVGYWTWRGAPSKPDEILRVHLTHWDREPNPGRVLGFATDSNDRPLSGALVIDVEDEFFRSRRESVVADERGAFTIDGLWHGAWRIWLDSGEPVDVAIRDGDEVRVRLRAKHDASLFAVKPWTGEMESAWLEALERFRRTRSRAEDLKKTGPSASETVAREAEEAAMHFLELDAAKQVALPLPRRDVLVVGLPTDGAYVVRAVCNGVVRSATATNGAARMASLSIDTWRFSLERFGVGTRPRDVDVVPGDGAQTVEFSLTK